LRGRLRAVGEVQHVLPERDQLDGRARLKVEELGGAGGRKSQGSVGETRGKGYMTTNININNKQQQTTINTFRKILQR
jgi:hypothetical protein